MAIQTVDVTVPGGDTPRSANIKINANFSDQTNAASRLVGTAAGNVMEVGAFGLGGIGTARYLPPEEDLRTTPNGFYTLENGGHTGIMVKQFGGTGNTKMGVFGFPADASSSAPFYYQINTVYGTTFEAQQAYRHTFWTTQNATKDSNGFLKGASPVVDMYDNKIDLNQDAITQGYITFEKLGVGDYLVKGSLGFAQEGWYIETPKDANGNVLVAVVYEQLKNNDLSIKTYAKRFDDETGDIVANLAKPRDIPTGRFISLRLHELPKEPPVMPTQNTSADAPAQTNNP